MEWCAQGLIWARSYFVGTPISAFFALPVLRWRIPPARLFRISEQRCTGFRVNALAGLLFSQTPKALHSIATSQSVLEYVVRTGEPQGAPRHRARTPARLCF